LGLSGGIPNFIACGTTVAEVRKPCGNLSTILLFMTESISADYGAILIELVCNDFEAIKIVYLLQEVSIASKVSSLDVDAVLMTTS
jgi:hypothetical protein